MRFQVSGMPKRVKVSLFSLEGLKVEEVIKFVICIEPSWWLWNRDPGGNLFAPGTAKTRQEIYILGAREPYT